MSIKDPLVTLVIFTCEKREHLLCETYESFLSQCNYKFFKTILAVDGVIKQDIISLINPDLLIQTPARKGYVRSIINTLPLISTEYFFWLEDDWLFPTTLNIEELIKVMDGDPDLIQVILSKEELDNEKVHYNGEYFLNNTFSANPCLCKTSDAKTAFKELEAVKKDSATQLTGFENFLDEFILRSSKKTIIKFNGNEKMVSHLGFLESTGREYHMINSLEGPEISDSQYISGFGQNTKTNVADKIVLVPKLGLAFLILVVQLFRSRKAYDAALRIYWTIRNILK